MEDRPGNSVDEPSRHVYLRTLRRAYTKALLDGDEIAAEAAVRDAMDARLSAAEIDVELIAPALWLVGDMWARGEISVADEHLATEITLRVLALQHAARLAADRRLHHRVLLAAPEGERHVVGLRMAGDLLREAGYGVWMLGADVPLPTLGAAVIRHACDVLCLTSTMAETAAMLPRAIDEVSRARPATDILVGGRTVPAMVARPGVSVCGPVTEAVASVDALLQRASSN